MTKIRCPRCGATFTAEQVDRDFQGMCPRCLADIALSPPDGNVPQPVPAIQPGTKFRGLEVGPMLGQGGMGVVYKARQPALERWVALKLLSAELAKGA